jgi:hypothetical protein
VGVVEVPARNVLVLFPLSFANLLCNNYDVFSINYCAVMLVVEEKTHNKEKMPRKTKKVIIVGKP